MQNSQSKKQSAESLKELMPATFRLLEKVNNDPRIREVVREALKRMKQNEEEQPKQ